ncbi:hypothetical protein Nepgr_016777 [Nepenthes gracilis]|uniref:CW-type domain-containing protein n=1 Tax=Nepenthes gracilis TaxID=150966 RepID=A0AAD3SQW3_NEPGR|nr:hypothetical protein Nepgr_016777 [Nepenthes gracilis]
MGLQRVRRGDISRNSPTRIPKAMKENEEPSIKHHAHSNFSVRPENENLQSDSVSVPVFQVNESPSRSNLITDGEMKEANVTSPSFAQWCTSRARDHDDASSNQRGQRICSSEKTQSGSSKRHAEPLATRDGSQMLDHCRHHFVMLTKDTKPICRTLCNLPIQLSSNWNITQLIASSSVESLSELSHFLIYPAFESSHQKKEWGRFLNFLYNYSKVAVAKFPQYEIYILPPDGSFGFSRVEKGLEFTHAKVAYRVVEAQDPPTCQKRSAAADAENVAEPVLVVSTSAPTCIADTCGIVSPSMPIMETCMTKGLMLSPIEAGLPCTHMMDSVAIDSDAGTYPCTSQCPEKVGESKGDTCSSLPSSAGTKDAFLEKKFVRIDPSYLKTLGQAHSGWIFGAIAELVDNSRDANASRLDISIETIYYKKAASNIPMLSVIDDGHGMSHDEICRMVSFGHKQPDREELDRIGRFGIGFKTGAMRLGRDALVLTQTAGSRSIAFLSQSLNEGKDNLEIPIVSYCREGQYMELDRRIQSEEFAEYNLNAIKDFSPFNEYLIGEKAASFLDNKTGTQIYIWNLDKWGSNHSLEWKSGMQGGSSFYHGDILIRSRRVRSRPGQTSRKVPLDYSLRSYLEVVFLHPRMKIYVQGSLIKSRPLAKSLSKTVVKDGVLMDKAVRLTLGQSQLEWEQANCGIFLYWHGRLIEAYKRVGGMIHSADTGRGIIGVVDVTDLMDDGSGCVLVHNNKQGFQDSEPYALLEEWLGKIADEYWDKHFDALQLEKGNALYKPDHEWVQCDKCRKWRILSSGFDCMTLPLKWFCYMEPFNGRCEIPEQEVDHGVITVSTMRSGYDSNQKPGQCNEKEQLGDANSPSAANVEADALSEAAEDVSMTPTPKRLKRGPKSNEYVKEQLSRISSNFSRTEFKRTNQRIVRKDS